MGFCVLLCALEGPALGNTGTLQDSHALRKLTLRGKKENTDTSQLQQKAKGTEGCKKRIKCLGTSEEKDYREAGVKESSKAEVAFGFSIKGRAEVQSRDAGASIKQELGSAGQTQEMPQMACSLG